MYCITVYSFDWYLENTSINGRMYLYPLLYLLNSDIPAESQIAITPGLDGVISLSKNYFLVF